MRRNSIRYRLRWIPTPVRRVLALVIGGTVVLIGIIMFVTPGPAIIVIPLGVAILAVEFVWAKRWLRKIRRTAKSVRGRMKERWTRGKPSPQGPPGV